LSPKSSLMIVMKSSRASRTGVTPHFLGLVRM
jgi:hypothetical protein